MIDFNNPLFGLREHRKKLSRREAQGAKLWSEYLDQEVRTKFAHTIVLLGQEHHNAVDKNHQLHGFADVVDRATRSVCFQLGIASLPHQHSWPAFENELLNTIVDSSTNKSLIFSLIEAIWQTTLTFLYPSTAGVYRDDPRLQFAGNVQTILEDHRIAYDFVEGRFIPRGEQIMHSSVVLPTLTLLSGRKQLATAESKYLDALKSIQERRFDDAITDSCATLEATLGALGCNGNTLGKKFHHAVSLGIATSYDKKIVEWLSADRGAKGDAHPEGSMATRVDAWLSAHVVGAFILRLADPEGRGSL